MRKANTRNKKLYLNTVSALLCQIITVLCGFFLPRFMLTAYGSTVNGAVSSISQFLGVISFMQLGVGAVVQSSFYEPLAKGDVLQMSRIYVSGDRFFKKIALIFTIYVVGLVLIYPKTVASQFDFWFSASLIVILSVSLFAQYYFGLVNQLLLNADQKAYIPSFLDGISVLLNTVVAIILIELGASIQVVKLVAAIVFILRPLYQLMYVQSHYKIDRKIHYTEEPIKQKWNGLAQHLASAVMDNTDVMILTVLSTLENVSVYYIYNMVVFGVRQLVSSLTVGIQSYFGNLLVDNQLENTRKTFEFVEMVFHIVITTLFSCVALLIVPFVRVYTTGINDVNYIVPLFAGIITFAQGIYCYRLVYYVVIKAAGHYKQTQNSAIIEMILNLTVSILCVMRWGLVGVAIGTFVATSYRTIYLVQYLRKNILYINIKKTIIRFITDLLVIICSYYFTSAIQMHSENYLEWIVMALKVLLVCIGISGIVNFMVNFVTLSKSKK